MDVKEGGVWVLAKPRKVTEESSVMPILERRGKPRGWGKSQEGRAFNTRTKSLVFVWQGWGCCSACQSPTKFP